MYIILWDKWINNSKFCGTFMWVFDNPGFAPLQNYIVLLNRETVVFEYKLALDKGIVFRGSQLQLV